MATAPESNLALTLPALHSSSSSSSSLNYEVFLSFRGTDTRKNFTDHLYNALIRNGIRTFRDEEELEIGEPIMQNLLKCIRESRISIPIISPDYASSRLCLEELAQIMECKRTIGQIVMPIFFHVDVGDVKNQTGSFVEPFCNHEKRFHSDKVSDWRQALREVVELKGYESKNVKNGHEAELVQQVLRDVLNELKPRIMHVAKYPIEIESRVKHMLSLLGVGTQDRRFVGVVGMGGLGKTTIAKAVFNKIHRWFDGSTFIQVDGETGSQDRVLISLQSKLICDVDNHEHGSTNLISHVDTGKSMIKQRMSAKKVLVILDNVDNHKQLEALVGERDWFGLGSRIIITTRDMNVLNVLGVDNIYKPKELDYPQSLQLLSWHAFRSSQPPNDFVDHSKKVALFAGGLPLVLEVLGCSLYGEKRLEAWEERLEKLKQVPMEDIHNKLKISYDTIDVHQKKIFLDIACFLIGTEEKIATEIWKGCDLFPLTGINVLVQKSLITIRGNKLWMHDQLRDMGRAIVYQESPENPGKRSRLWHYEDVLVVLRNRKGTKFIEGLTVSVKGDVFKTKAFAKMSNLRLLRVEGARLEGNFEDLPPQLRWLCLKGCFLDFTLNRFHLEKLVVLDLSETNIIKINGHQNNKNLKVIILRGCHYLEEFPTSICNPASLESLDLVDCYKLNKLPSRLGDMKSLTQLLLRESSIEQLPDSVGFLQNLKTLGLDKCRSLTRLPNTLGKLTSLKMLSLSYSSIREIPDSIESLKKLETLDAQGCSSLTMLPNTIGGLVSLLTLQLDETGILELPESIGGLLKLEELRLEQCTSLGKLPDSLGRMESLTSLVLNGSPIKEFPDIRELKCRAHMLDITDCSFFSRLPDSIGNLINLTSFDINGTIIKELPDGFCSLAKLKVLNILDCKSFSRLPDSIGNLINLTHFYIKGTIITELPDAFVSLENLEDLCISDCKLFSRLPDSIGNLINLNSFEIRQAIITELPDAFGSLENLEELRILDCKLFSRLPDSIGNLINLTSFHIREAIITELPDAFGSLEDLKTLQITDCKLFSRLPDSIGKLKNLTSFHIIGTIITELPEAFGSLENLGMLEILDCKLFSRLPDSIGNLINLKSFEIREAIITKLPDAFGSLESLKKLVILDCKLFSRLPDSIGNLINLEYFKIREAIITELPDAFGSLENLKDISLYSCKMLVKLPDSMAKLKRLIIFEVRESSIVELPKDFGMLSSLHHLEISDCQEFKCFPDTFGSLTQLMYLNLENNSKLTVRPPSLSRLRSLKKLKASHCNLSGAGAIPDVFGELSSLEILDLGYNNFRSLPTSISGISLLQELSLQNCTELALLPELPTSLIELDLTNCLSMESLRDLSNLKRLRKLSLVNCDKLPEIQGLGRLESLEILNMGGCTTFANTLKKSLSQGVFEGFRHFSFPGSEIPKWFTHQNIVSSTVPRVRNFDDEIEGWILCFVFAIDENTEKDLHQSYATSFIPDAELQIWRDHKKLASTRLLKRDIPKVHQDHIYLEYFQEGRFPQYFNEDYVQFIKELKYGGQIQISTLETPGFHVKKAGVHVVYKPKEGFDDDGIESAMEEDGHQSVSIAKKLSEFFTGSACSCGINEGESTSVKKANKRGRDDEDEDEEIVKGKSKRNVPFPFRTASAILAQVQRWWRQRP